MPSTTRNPRQPRIDATRTTTTRHNPVVGITLLLQLRSATPGAQVRAGNQDSGDAGWSDYPTVDVQGGVRVHVYIIN